MPKQQLAEFGVGGESLAERMLRAMVAELQGSVNAGDIAEKYIDPDPIHFIQTNFYIPETGQPLELHESQIVPLREALAKDPDGNFRYSLVIWSSVKKSAKTTIAAAVCLWMMWQRPWSSAKLIANDLRQANTRVFEYIKRAVLLHPEWRSVCKVVNYKIYLPNHSTIEAIPIDPEGEAGGNDDFVEYTELWGWKSEAEKRLWTESTLSPTKFGRSMRWVDTYAGEEGESPVLEPMYERVVKNGECIDEFYEMYRSGRTFALWCTQHHLPYQTEEYLNQERESLLPSEFDRVHGNRWSTSSEAFVPITAWDACRMPVAEMPAMTKDTPIILSLDAGVSNDLFALTGVSGNTLGKYYVRFAVSWKAPAGQHVDFGGEKGPEWTVRWLIENYNVVEVCYDPYQLEDMAQRLRKDMVCFLYEFNQGKPRAVADKGLYDAILHRDIYHDGDEKLREHIANANRQTTDDNKLRIVKRAPEKKIDLTVSLSMALSRAIFWRI